MAVIDQLKQGMSRAKADWVGVGGAVVKAGEASSGFIGKVAGGGATAGGGLLGNVAYGATRLLGPKPWLIGGGVIAGAAALGTYFAITAKDKKHFDPDAVPVQPIPPLLTPQDLMMQPMPHAMEGGPAEGYADHQWRNMVNSSRGQSLEQPAVNTTQPRMSAISPDAVQDMGGKPLAV